MTKSEARAIARGVRRSSYPVRGSDEQGRFVEYPCPRTRITARGTRSHAVRVYLRYGQTLPRADDIDQAFIDHLIDGFPDECVIR